MSAPTVEALLEENRQLKDALRVAAVALDIAADWNLDTVQARPPVAWNLPGGSEDAADGWCSTSALASYLCQLAQGEGVASRDYAALFKQACRIALDTASARYLMANAYGRRDGCLKADMHRVLCEFYVSAIHNGDPDTIRRTHDAEYRAVHQATQALTDHLDEVIGFPLNETPDYDRLVPAFFDQFHQLAMGAL